MIGWDMFIVSKVFIIDYNYGFFKYFDLMSLLNIFLDMCMLESSAVVIG